METDSLARLTPNARNPRKISKKKLAMLKESMAYYGDLSGIIQLANGGDLVGGHQRVEAFRGDPKAKVEITQRYEPPLENGTVAEGYVTAAGSRFAYRVCDWAPDKAQGAMLAANKGAGEWDLPLVADMMGELNDAGFQMDLTLFDASERNSVLNDSAASEEPEGDDGGADDIQAESKTRPGDLYEMGQHRLLCGDSADPNAIKVLMEHADADMVYTDPPYGIALDVDYSAKQGAAPKWKGPKHKKVHGDDIPFDASFLVALFPSAKEVFLWGAENYAKTIPDGGSWVCWDKKLEAHDEYSSGGFELCWSKKRHHYQLARIVWTGFLATEHGEKRCHPTQKPVALANWFFDRWGKANDVVVDLYAGSGSTLLACEDKERRCRAMEIDPHYCDLIVARWERKTGKTAILVSSAGVAEQA